MASSGSALSDGASTPSSFAFSPPSPSDTSRPNTSSSSMSYGPLPSAFGGLQLRGGGGSDGHSSSSSVAGAGEAANNSGGEGGSTVAGGASSGSDTENSKQLRQLWSTWLATPFSSSSEKDAFVMSNGVLTPLNHPSALSSNSAGNKATNPTLSAVPSHMYPAGSSPTKQDQMGQQQQIPYALQKSMSLPAIRTPSGERRSMADLPTPRINNHQT